MNRLRPIGRLTRELEKAEPAGTLDQMALQLVIGLTTRTGYERLSVKQTARVLRLALAHLRTADDEADRLLRVADGEDPPAVRYAKNDATATQGQRQPDKQDEGILRLVEKRGRRKNPALLRRVLEFRTENPDKTNVAAVHRELAPGCTQLTFRKYWKAVEPLLQKA